MPEPGDDDLMDLDFTLPGALPAEVEEAQPSPQSVSSVPLRIEEIARLYADGQAAQACSLLEGVLHQEDFGDATELAWGMQFDLYHLLGRRQAYEALALGFAGQFEKSPPTWPAPAADAPALGKDGLATVTLSGVLGANAVQPLGKLREMAGKVTGVRLDLAKVRDADDTGCGALLETLRVFKQLKKACVLVGGDELARTLSCKTVMGERNHESTWLLLLDLYQNLDRQDAFEEAAVGYAVTFEVSPPSWEAPKAAAPAVAAAKPATKPVDGCVLAGELTGGGREPFAALLDHAARHEQATVDTAALLRMDGACAAEFAAVLGELKGAGKKVRIRGASHLLVALWRALGIDKLAAIEPRKL